MINLKNLLGLLSIIIFFPVLIAYIFRSLLLNISTNLIDWLDYTLMVWIINQNIGHIKNLQLDNFFNSNIFYPFQGTMLFSDLLLPSSILGLVFQIFSPNPVLVFNLIFFTTLFLNVWGSFILWKIFFSDKLIIFFGILITAFSPYFFLELGHFQMINFWPFLFGLYFLFKERFSIKNAILVGIMISLEFFSSVYLWIFMLFAVGIWYGMKLIHQYFQKKALRNIIIHGLIVLLSFSILSGPFVLKYIQIKQDYNIVRSPGEYILYSAHLSDYLFTTHYQSFISTTKLANLWNSFNRHVVGESAGFPGMVLLVLSIIGLITLQRNRKRFSLDISLSFYNVFFLVLLISGFLFSLGPRLSVNGVYLGIPLPYYVILKFFPLVEPIRANSRWIWFLFLGLNYFALKGLNKFSTHGRKRFILTIFFTALFLLEIIPVNKTTGKKDYYPIIYETIEKRCTKSPEMLLEYPMTRFITDNNIIENLTYKTQLQLASVKHKCLLINGYSGFTPKDYEKYEDQLFWAIEKRDKDLFWKLMADRKVIFFKLNKESLYEDRIGVIENWLNEKDRSRIYFNNSQYLLAEIYSDLGK